MEIKRVFCYESNADCSVVFSNTAMAAANDGKGEVQVEWDSDDAGDIADTGSAITAASEGNDVGIYLRTQKPITRIEPRMS